MEEAAARRRRINHLKKIILGMVVAAVLIPTAACIFLGMKVATLSDEVETLTAELEEERNRPEEITGVFSTEHIEESPRNAGAAIISKGDALPETETGKKIYLTFDDGPSSSTNAILDILKAYDVKATFFVVGKTDEASRQAYRRIVEEGHTLGMHSYSHEYREIYQSMDSFTEDFSKLQEYLYEVTGVWPRYYRFPGGSSNIVSRADMKDLIAWLEERDITYFDWNVEAGDAVTGHVSKETIINNCLSEVRGQQECIILMHDAADKKSTVEALPEVITGIRMQQEACFLPITDDTAPVQHRK